MLKEGRGGVREAQGLVGELQWTADWGLHYEKGDGAKSFGVEAHSDASYAPITEHSSQRKAQYHRSGWMRSALVVFWAATAEAELLSYMECHQQAEGVAALLECLTRSEVQRCIYGDNRSAEPLQGDVGAWRTRHLRLRAAGLRSAVACPLSGWAVHRVKGTLQTDCQGSSGAFETFCAQVGMSSPMVTSTIS